MSKLLRESLWKAHLTDLQDVIADAIISPIPDETFTCPICLDNFSKSGIYDKTLTDGHIWPQTIRAKGEQARHQRILLCDSCNSKAGMRGDSQMQLGETVKNAHRHGDYGERRIQFLLGFNEKPITLNARVVIPDKDKPTNVRVRFPVDRKHKRWARNNPYEQARFEGLKSENRKVSMIVYPYPLLKSQLARVGWLTSAYLMAFYTFGYRYILHPSLDPVRKCILDSFENDKPTLPESEISGIFQCSGHCSRESDQDPDVEVILPLNDESPIYLQVSFWDYHVRLPFHCNPETFAAAMQLFVPNEFVIPAQKDASIGIGVQCTKTNIHDCIWDYILGKKIPLD